MEFPGYHDIPDVERKVLTRAENKKLFGKGPASLVTTLDLDTAVEAYYISMSEMQKKTGKQNVVFLHVPKLDSEEELQVSVRVTEELIKALIGVCK